MHENIAYKDGRHLSGYERERCHLDLYAPAGAKDLPCLIWLHGGGLIEGSKSGASDQAICRALAGEGMLVACANYRLSPRAKYPAYVEDAAAVVAWVCRHAGEYGGDPGLVFVSGNSAGAYLVGLLGVNDRYLHAVGIDGSELAGFIPVSGQMMTHFAVREERGLPKEAITADEAAPINHTRPDTPPWLILHADDDFPLRSEENRYFAAAMVQSGHPDITLREIADRNHGNIAERIADPGDPARVQIVAFVRRIENQKKAKRKK